MKRLSLRKRIKIAREFRRYQNGDKQREKSKCHDNNG